ncbi:hypothetical protein [Streptomyces sp. NPDC001205]
MGHLSYVVTSPADETRRAGQLCASRALTSLLREQLPPVELWTIDQGILRGFFAPSGPVPVQEIIRSLYREFGGRVFVRGSTDEGRELGARFAYRNQVVELSGCLPPPGSDFESS